MMLTSTITIPDQKKLPKYFYSNMIKLNLVSFNDRAQDRENDDH